MQQGDIDIFNIIQKFYCIINVSGLRSVTSSTMVSFKTENLKYSEPDFLISLKIFGIHVSIDDMSELCTGDQAKPLKYSCASNALFLMRIKYQESRNNFFKHTLRLYINIWETKILC